jgi:DNA mismatch repair protein MutS
MPPKKVGGAPGAKRGVAGYATAMETQYFQHYDAQIAKSGPKTAVLFQVGTFFELYDYVDKVGTDAPRTNVQIIAELCGCVVEPRVSGDPTKHRLFWGFPEHSLPKFERILIAAGYTVRVIVQNKDATGEVASRTIDHVSSPGTFWDGDGGLAVRRDEQCVISVYIEPYMDTAKRQQHWYIASSAFDVMTGKSVSVESDVVLIDGRPVLDVIQPFWSVYPPAEIVFLWVAPRTANPPKTSEIASMFPGAAGGRIPPIHVAHLDPKSEDGVGADRLRLAFLGDVFKHQNALSVAEHLGVTMYHNARRSLFHLLQFVKDHNPSYLTALHEHSMWSPEDHVLLGNSALEQLAMVPTNSDKPHESLLYWLQCAQTIMGRRALRERCLKPLADVETLNARQDRIAALRHDPTREALERILRGSYDLPRLYRKFQLGRGTTDDLLQLITTYEKAAALITATAGQLYGVQEEAAEYMRHINSVLDTWDGERIRKSRAQVDHPVAVGSTHPWKRGLHADLDALEDSWNALETSMLTLKRQWEDALEETDAITWTLRDDAPFTFQTTARRGTNLAALVKRRYKTDVTIVKRGSSSTVTLESSAITEANTAAIKVRAAWRAAVGDRWTAVWQTWMDTEIEAGMLEALVDMMGTLDAECAFAAVADKFGYVRPTYVESTKDAPAGMSIKDLRHPIIERVHTSASYIPHSLAFGAFASSAAAEDTASALQGMLLYGVNAAGKSSLGKALGLAVLMAQCGIPVPASAMTLIPYTALFTRILGNDNLWAGMSSFVVEMTEFRSILRAAGPRTLVIGDELCAGTETASATAIVAAGVQTLNTRGCHYFFATHLHELASVEEIASNPATQFYHLTVHSDHAAQRLVYDRKLRAGTGSPMYGLEVCRGLDMDPAFLTAAFTFRKRLFDESGSARLSAYNAAVVVAKCAVCGSHDALETHHIVQQAAADAAGMIGPGKHKNTKENLVPLCSACHDAHHGGLLEITGWVDTSMGPVLQFKSRSV